MFKHRPTWTGTEVAKCSCGQTFKFESVRDWDIKIWMHRKVCPKLVKGYKCIRVPKKAMTLKEQEDNVVKRTRRVSQTPLVGKCNTFPCWKGITISECNSVVTLYLRELTSTLLSQRLFHLRDNISHSYWDSMQLFSVHNSSQTISYPLLFYIGLCVLCQVVASNPSSGSISSRR